MKTILAQIFSDDSAGLDLRLFNIKTRKIKQIIEEIISKPKIAKDQLPDTDFISGLNINDSQIDLKLKIRNFYAGEKDPLKFFKDNIKENKYKKLKAEFHNI